MWFDPVSKTPHTLLIPNTTPLPRDQPTTSTYPSVTPVQKGGLTLFAST